MAEISRIRVARVILVSGEEAIDTAIKEMIGSLETVAKERSKYETHITRGTPDERLLKEFDEHWAGLLKTYEQIRVAVKKGEHEKAVDLYNKESFAQMGKARKALNDASDYNQEEGDKAGKHGAEVYAQTVQIMIAVSLVAIVMTLAMTMFIIRNVSLPITQMTGAMEKLGAGDKTIAVPGLGRGDEIGGMAHALNVFKQTAIEAERLEGISKQEQAAKESRQKKIDGYISKFQAEASGAMQQLAAASTEMRSTAESMSATAEETSRQSTAVAAASEEASSSVATVASAAEELSASITEIERQAKESRETADKAVAQAKSTEGTVRGLEAATSKISDVMNLINDIASQTNLLALNATIEAARAGDAGKGFAVVASEVKNLAGQTAKATDEVGAQIAAMQQATKDVVEAIGKIGETITHMSKMTSDISGVVEQQSAAVREIAHNAQQASTGTQEVSSTIVGVNRAAKDTGSAATQVLETAGDLSKQSEGLKTHIDGFLNNIKTA